MEMMKTDGGMQFGKGAYLIVPDPQKPSTWKVRVEEEPGKVTVAQLGRAAAALTGGFRGNKVEATDAEINAAKSKLRRMYQQMKAEPPDAMKESLMEQDVSGIRITELLLDGLVGLSIQEAEDGTPYIKGATIIQPGESKNKNVHTGAVLSRDGPSVFEGLPIYATNHNPADKNIRNLIAVSENVRFEDGRLKGDLRGMKSEKALLEKALEASQVMGSERVGLSIDVKANAVMKQTPKGRVRELTRYLPDPGNSVDLVMNPSAGGRLTESLTEESEEMDFIAQLTEAVLSSMNTASVQYITESLTDEEIKQKNPALAAAIIAKRDGSEGNPKVEPAPKTTVQEARTEPTLTAEQIKESVNQQVEERLRVMECGILLKSKVTEAKLGDFGEFIEGKYAGKVFEEADLDKDIKSIRDKMAALNPRLPYVPGSGDTAKVTEAFDKNRARLECAMLPYAEQAAFQFNGERIRPFSKISEAILAFHDDRIRDYVDNRNAAIRESLPLFTWGGGELGYQLESGRIQESISVGTFTSAFADVLNKMLLSAMNDPDLATWRPLVSNMRSFDDLTHSHKMISRGEFGTFPTVAERGAYQDLGQFGERQQALSIVKKGGTVDLSLESLLVDDIGILGQIPRGLGLAWAWTVYDVVFGVFQLNTGTGPTMDYDSTVLYHSDHANIYTAAFTDADLETAREAMAVQTDFSSGKRKVIRPRFLLYQSPQLERTIWESLQSMFKVNPLSTSGSQVNLPNFIREVLSLEPVPVMYPTATTTRWELVGNPADAPTLAVGFLGGKETLDVFVQDMETAGARFTSDVITYKGRGTVGATYLSHESAVRGNL